MELISKTSAILLYKSTMKLSVINVFHFVVLLSFHRPTINARSNNFTYYTQQPHPPIEFIHHTNDEHFKAVRRIMKSSTYPTNSDEMKQRRINESISPKLGGALTHLVDKFTNTGNVLTRTDDVTSYGSVTMVGNDAVLVDVVGNGIVDNMSTVLSTDGFRTINCYKQLCSMYVPIDKLVDLANLEYVNFLRPVLSKANAGSVTSEGDKALKTDIIRSKYKVNGTGILIGVLSDSFDCLNGAQGDFQSKDLPSLSNIVFIRDLNKTECIAFAAQDEGRSMMQIIHDVAPGAQLAFRSAVRGQADFVAGIDELASAGCNVIVDDITYFSEPFFQDGIIAQAVDYAVNELGLLYFSAIGNQGSKSWETTYGFVPSGIRIGNGEYHLFGISSNGNPITFQQLIIINSDEDITFIFQWSEPYASAGRFGSTSDMDIYFKAFVAGEYITIASGVDLNVGNDPTEVVKFNPASLGSTDYIVFIDMYIVRYTGTSPQYMKVIAFSDTDISFEYSLDGSSTSFGHANSASGAGVGAANYARTPAFSISPPEIESYSALGGTPILFDEQGVRLQSASKRNQPRFIGPDETSTTFKFIPPRKRFSGTSAAAPHVAATAALLLEATDASLSSYEIYEILEESAIDMGDVGFDYKTGNGFIDAPAAFVAANVKVPPCGLFGLSLICFCGCGFFKRLLAIGGC
jgi:Subtilase family